MKFEVVELSSPTDHIGPPLPQKPLRSKRVLTKTNATLALLVFVIVMGYLWIFEPPEQLNGTGGRTPRDEQVILDVDLEVHHHNHMNVHHHHHHHVASTFSGHRLTKGQQLAAVTAYILSPLHSNSLPLNHDIQVEDLLEFDINSRRADDMLQEMVSEIWAGEQVVVYGKLHHPPTRALHALVKSWALPRPSLIYLDQRQDGSVLERVLRHVLSVEDDAWSLPLLLIRGNAIMGLDKIKTMRESGELEALLNP